MFKRILFLILLVTFLKELVWVSLVPLWHFPDEQSHFGQLAFLAEVGRQPGIQDKKDLTEEIRKSEELLGTERDNLGINKFTYHPEYRIEYSNSYIGKYEQEIISFAKNRNFREMVKSEASRYSPLYYAFLALFYRIFYEKDLFVRVFIIRIIQIIFCLGTVYFAWLIGREIFSQEKFFGLTLASLVSFHPMFSFVSAGINSENIGNFIFSLFILLGLRILNRGLSFRRIVALFGVAFLSLYIKPQLIIVVPLSFLLFFWLLITVKYSRLKKIILFIFLSVLGLLIGKFFLQYDIGPTVVFWRLLANFNFFDFLNYLWSYAIFHLYREVLPWYWGIYNWLGVTYPREVHRVINWVILFSLIGLGIWLIKSIKQCKLQKKISKEFISISFLIIASIMLFLGIYLFDWLEFTQRKIHLGVQGRYFFPTIAAHMGIFLLGLKNLMPDNFRKWQLRFIKFIGIAMVFLNFFALYTVAKAYYDIFPLMRFIIQASQYKPWFFKGSFLLALWVSYFITVMIFLLKYIQYSDEKNIKTKEK